MSEQPVCTPEDQDRLRHSGCYPSGHSAIGWAWALILGEITPERANALIARGRNYRQSRRVCNVHWQSDVLAGRVMGAATVARLHAEPAFRTDLEGARKEIAAARAQGLAPANGCAAQAKTLQVQPAGARQGVLSRALLAPGCGFSFLQQRACCLYRSVATASAATRFDPGIAPRRFAATDRAATGQVRRTAAPPAFGQIRSGRAGGLDSPQISAKDLQP
jgi:hypothetical protein